MSFRQTPANPRETIPPALARHPLAPALAAAVQASLAGGEILRDFAVRGFTVSHKGAIDLVTEADIAAEEAIIASLKNDLGHGISLLAEESASRTGNPDGPLWIIDPLDGTTNFAHGFPWYAVSIAYAEAGRLSAGVVYNVPLNELFVAVKGGGAWFDNRLLRVSATSEFADALFATGFPYDTSHSAAAVAELGRVLPLCQGVRRAGSAALDLAQVAAGRLEGYWEAHLKPWDMAAGVLLVEEAGGMVTDRDGKAFNPFGSRVMATNGHLHDQLLTIIHEG